VFGKKDIEKHNELVTVGGGRSVESAKLKNQHLVEQVFSINEKNNSSTSASGIGIQAFFTDPKLESADYMVAKDQLMDKMLERIQFSALEKIPMDQKKIRIRDVATQIITQEIHIPLTAPQVELLKNQAIDDMLGFGPLEVLIADSEISDIMINGSKQVFVEKKGKILLTDVTFLHERHLLNTIQKIVSLVGRRVDESSPMVDARMPDGSRFNAIVPPLALDGSLVSIRKFRKSKFTLKEYVELGSMTADMAKFLAICGSIRLNIIISGGTGSGKTTLLNAISGHIAATERVITIEDTAELQLQQIHVLRTETRPPNMQDVGEITARQLVKNALRMRPDRIIIGEIRSDEVIDVLSAMNTGHDGSMATIHANTPRDALSRIENLIGMSKVSLALNSLRNQIASAVHLIVQVARQRDGKRRITHIEEVIGMQGDDILTRQLFGFHAGAMGNDGVLGGEFFCTGVVPKFIEQAAYFGREEELLTCIGGKNE
jgi:pilus assembly protein CpaF